jgi:pimeloyl-ACP methyl ester carboxylesterase
MCRRTQEMVSKGLALWRGPGAEPLALPSCLLLLALVLPVSAHAQGLPGLAYTEPLGIGLEAWPYPYPVKFMPLAVQGQAVRMAYMDVAPSAVPNGRTALLLHGKNFDSSYWAGPIEALRGAGYRVVVPDQIGFNKSAKPDIAYGFDLLADATLHLLDTLGVGEADVVGHSTGGMLAVRLATRAPVRVRRLLLEDPIGLEDYRRTVPEQSTQTLVDAEARQNVEEYRAFVGRYFVTLPLARYERFVEWRARVGLSGEFDRYARAVALTYQMIWHDPVRAAYPGLAMPVLLMVGAKDRAAPLRQYAPPALAATMGDMPALARQACAEVARCRLVVVPDTGHVPHLEAPELFGREMLAFLGEA